MKPLSRSMLNVTNPTQSTCMGRMPRETAISNYLKNIDREREVIALTRMSIMCKRGYTAEDHMTIEMMDTMKSTLALAQKMVAAQV
jgi:hypothetical protein